MKKYLITGTAGFIGFHFAQKLLENGFQVWGVDNLNDYYDVGLKNARLSILQKNSNYIHTKENLENLSKLTELFKEASPDVVVNLAAQAGVQYSIKNPQTYIDSNITGFLNILNLCRDFEVEHLVYASSSSVYGANTSMPFSTSGNADHPLSLYAASKKCNELMAHTYSHLFNLPTTGLRFFTVYGPWGRPDMALFLFTKAIIEDKPIKIFNNGKHKRDFTYIDDIVEGIYRVCMRTAKGNPMWNSNFPDPGSSKYPWKVYNIGNSNPVELLDYVEQIELCLGKKAKKELLPLQPGDVPETYANVDDLMSDVNYRPSTPIQVGVKNFVNWYKKFYRVKE